MAEKRYKIKQDAVAKPSTASASSSSAFDWKAYAADPANKKRIAKEKSTVATPATGSSATAKPGKTNFVTESISAVKKKKKALDAVMQ